MKFYQSVELKWFLVKSYPGLDDLDFNAQVVNALVYKSLANTGVTISKNVGFYNDGVIVKLLCVR